MKEMQKLLIELGKKCNEKKISVVTAESCTGGGIAYTISKTPECSAILERGYVVYSLSSKEEMLQISPYTLQTYGLVSEETAKAMAQQALKLSKAQASIAITGIDEEGAKEDSSNHPGLVWIAFAGIDKKVAVKKLHVKGNRLQFCEETIFESLKFLLTHIE